MTEPNIVPKLMTEENLCRWAEIHEKSTAFGHLFMGDAPPAWYPSPIHIPEVSAGKIKVTHRIEKAGTKLPIVSTREALLRGQRPVNAVLKEDMVIHELSEQGQGVWMTDLPCELNQAMAAIKLMKPKGKVLVGGLGLGILPAYLTQVHDVETITVVEKNPSVIKLCANRALYDVKQDDIRTFIRNTPAGHYDVIFLDTWQEQTESAFWHEVFPLRRLVRSKLGPVRLWCWKDDEFMSQAYNSLRQQPEGFHWWHRKLPMPLSHDEAVFFLIGVGSPEWESRYGDMVK
jgi:hypothetical protein